MLRVFGAGSSGSKGFRQQGGRFIVHGSVYTEVKYEPIHL